jgi:hypothetical protein
MEKLTFENINVPESLDSMVDDLLNRLPVKKRWIARKIIAPLASFVGLIFVLSILIWSSATFANMAKEIPGLDLIVKLIRQDDGVNHAKDKGYPVLGPFVYHDGDYELILSNIMIDEKRINFISVLSGPHFDGKMGKASEPVRFHISDLDQVYRDEYVVSLLADGPGLAIHQNNFVGDAHSTSILLSEPYEGYIRKLLDAGKPLPLKVEIQMKTADKLESIYTMKNIEVPFSRKDALLTREYALDDSLVTPHGVIRFKTLEISPTAMELHCGIEPNGVDDFGLYKFRVISSDGTEMSSPSSYTFGENKGVRTYQIMPSLYFDEPKSLMVMYDSYYYTLPAQPYTLDLNDKFPKAYDYYGHTFIVDEVKRLENDRFSVEFHVEDETGMEIQSIKLDGKESHVIDYSSEGKKTTVFFKEEEKKDVYTMTLDCPQIIVQEKGKVEIRLH